MRSKKFGLVVCVLTVALASQVWAKDKANGKRHRDAAQEEQGAQEPKAAGNSAEPWVQAKLAITSGERDIIRTYAHSCMVPERPGKKPKGLPPGLAKKVSRGQRLPPGWEKKCVPGEIMPKAVYKRCEPLPKEVVVKLPPSPPGTILVAIDGKVARLVKATLEILDVFDVL